MDGSGGYLEALGDKHRKKITVSDIRQSYTSEKERIDMVSHLWLYLVVRRVSFRLSPLFVNWGFSANAVTVLGLLPLVPGLVLLALGSVNYYCFIIGAVLVNIWVLFDCIDGDIARFKGQVSTFGALLDFIVGLIYHALLPVCLGLGLYWNALEDTTLALGQGFPGWVWLVAGVVEMSTGLLRKIVSLQSQIGVEYQSRKPENSSVTIWDVLPKAVLSFKAPLLLIASLLGVLGFFLFGYATYNLVTLVVVVLLALRKKLLDDRQQFKFSKG